MRSRGRRISLASAPKDFVFFLFAPHRTSAVLPRHSAAPSHRPRSLLSSYTPRRGSPRCGSGAPGGALGALDSGDLGVCCLRGRRAGAGGEGGCSSCAELRVRARWSCCSRRELEMYGPPSRGGGGASAAGEQPRVYQVWRGSNVSSPPSVSLTPAFGFCVLVNSASGSAAYGY